MEKTIEINGVATNFKSSAATNFLYKRTFHEDITLKLTEYSRMMKDIQSLQGKLQEIRESSLSDDEKLQGMSEIMENPVFEKGMDFQNDTLPKLAYIMYLEGNDPAEQIFKKLTEENYLIWLMTFEQQDLLGHTNEILDLWKTGARTSSKAKN